MSLAVLSGFLPVGQIPGLLLQQPGLISLLDSGILLEFEVR